MQEANLLRLKSSEEYQIGAVALQKKAKTFYEVKGHPKLWVMRCTDLITEDDNTAIREEIPGKGQLNAQISAMLFELLNGQYVSQIRDTPIKTHYIGHSTTNASDCLVYKMAQAIPLEVIVRNWAYGSYVRRNQVPEGIVLDPPICEFTVKDDAKHDPVISCEEIVAQEIATEVEVDHMREVALAANRIMGMFFNEIGINLVDFKLVFGRQANFVGDYTNIRIIGELSPDVFRLRDAKTGKILDKDIFRTGLPGLTEAYAEVLMRMSEQQRRLTEDRFIRARDSNNYGIPQ